MAFPVEMKWIHATQEKLGVKFPTSFIVAMSKCNGGGIETEMDSWSVFPFWDASDKKRLKRTCNSIDRETQSAREGWFGFPSDGVAIAGGMCGDVMLLLPMRDAPDTLQHTIYWWDHETGDVHWLADDFGDL
ncbi:SMI1/KNR4 family protein [Blastopirellula marina]|uniref:SMI1/KNR4 family protein n=1 Tax=Blastopirellula marina TaxID=124 RepID=A0A2S8GLE2_9BACT|nr:SMI1/KNR4 family protein [Blastopirellula marina]PQO45252.1 SMI1/KNR4 family protein [Blastopirellula marina]